MRTTVVTTTYTKKKGKKNTVIPNVIDAKLIVEAINADQDKEYEGGIINIQNIVFQNLVELSLSFKNIMEIQNLKSLEKLQKLQLDNNLISKIQNIDHLVHLKWLDLSFNSIEKIEGLSTLTKLEDLSLYDNKITQLEGLENCTQLNVFSIGNNKIETYDVITNYFGMGKMSEATQAQALKYKKLQVLNVAGNPFTKDSESSFRDLIIAHLPGLKYLDYQFIDEQDREKIRADDKLAAETTKQEEFFQIMSKEIQLEQEEEQKLQEKLNSKMHLLDTLHDEFTGIQEIKQIKVIKPDSIEVETKKFSDKIVAIVKGIQEEVMAKNKIKQRDFKEFEEAQADRIRESEEENIKLIKEFEKIKKHSFRDNEKIKLKLEEYDQIQERDRNDDKMKQRSDLMTQSEEKLKILMQLSEELKDSLIGVEILLDDELKEGFNKFKTQISNFVGDEISKEISKKGNDKMEEAIVDYYQKLSDIAKIELDKYTANPPNPDEQEEMNQEEEDRIEFMESKEQTTAAISTIKDTLQEKQSEKLQKVESEINLDLKNYDTNRVQMMYNRNRQNIQQIQAQIETYQEEIRNELHETLANFENE